MKVDYLRTDSLNQDYIDTDTLTFTVRGAARQRAAAEERIKKGDGDEEAEDTVITFLEMKTNVQNTFELFNPIRIEFGEPVMQFDSSYVQLQHQQDTLFIPSPSVSSGTQSIHASSPFAPPGYREGSIN